MVVERCISSLGGWKNKTKHLHPPFIPQTTTTSAKQTHQVMFKDTAVSRHSPVALSELLLTFLIQLLSTANQVGRGQGSLADPSLLKAGPGTRAFSKKNFKVRGLIRDAVCFQLLVSMMLHGFFAWIIDCIWLSKCLSLPFLSICCLARGTWLKS